MAKTIKRRLEENDGELADDDGPIFSTAAKLVKALDRAIPHSNDLEARGFVRTCNDPI